jgi:hypothetical protein
MVDLGKIGWSAARGGVVIGLMTGFGEVGGDGRGVGAEG